ncbi:MAG: hypothetical protein AABZ47_17655, partial [Planctomycetota bacterium]
TAAGLSNGFVLGTDSAGKFEINNPLNVHNALEVSTNGRGYGIRAEAGSRGVYALATSTDSYNAGVQGITASSEGVGVAASNTESDTWARMAGGDFGVKSHGDLVVENGAYRGTIGPNNGAPFPRPAYDSGWTSIDWDENLVLRHDIGGNRDDYVVDIQVMHNPSLSDNGVSNFASTGDADGSFSRGIFWWGLTTSEIVVHRGYNEGNLNRFRVRIWVVK